MTINELFQWWNLIFLLPLIASLIWIISTMMMGMHGGHDAIHHIGNGIHAGHDIGDVSHGSISHGTDVGGDSSGADISAHGHDINSGHGDHSGHNTHTDTASDQNQLISRAAWFLGINDVPITMLGGIFFLCWGVIGLLSNQILASPLRFPAAYAWISMIIAFFGGFIITRLMAAIVSKIIPTNETYSITRFELIGYPGRTIHITNENSGTVDIKDNYGNVHRVQAKTDNNDTIPPLTEIIVVDYDDSDKRFIVRKA